MRYVKTSLDGGWYHGFSANWILSVTGQAGYVGGWGGDTVRINDRFFAGGGNGGGAIFRGFQVAGIGPRDTTPGLGGEALGGKLYAVGAVEETFPNGLPEQYGIHTSALSPTETLGLLDNADKRQPGSLVTDPFVRDDLALRVSAGISIYWKSPLGPLRIDLAVPVVKTILYGQDPGLQLLHPNQVLMIMMNRLTAAAILLAAAALAPVAYGQSATTPQVQYGPAVPGLCVFSRDGLIAGSTVGKAVARAWPNQTRAAGAERASAPSRPVCRTTPRR